MGRWIKLGLFSKFLTSASTLTVVRVSRTFQSCRTYVGSGRRVLRIICFVKSFPYTPGGPWNVAVVACWAHVCLTGFRWRDPLRAPRSWTRMDSSSSESSQAYVGHMPIETYISVTTNGKDPYSRWLRSILPSGCRRSLKLPNKDVSDLEYAFQGVLFQ